MVREKWRPFPIEGCRLEVSSLRRGPQQQGRNHLTEAQVLEIRRHGAVDHSGAELRRLAGIYGVSRSAIEDVIFCRNWKHLPGEPPPRLPRGRPRKSATPKKVEKTERPDQPRGLAPHCSGPQPA